jgi:hypothetical protein
MANEVSIFSGKLPAHILARAGLSEVAKALAGSSNGGRRISIKNGVWRLLDGGKEVGQIEERYLDVAIVKAAPKVGRVFFIGKYDPASTAGPDCWSGDGETPDASIKSPQASSCAKCEKNVAGSGQGNSRACRFQQRIAVATLSDLMEHGEDAPVMSFSVPATSLFGKADGDKRPLQEYARWLVAQKYSPDMVVTRMKFDTSDDVDAVKVVFKAMRWLDDTEMSVVETLAESPIALEAVTMSFAPSAKVEDEVAGAPPVRKAKAPVVEEEDEAPAPKAKKPAVKAKAQAQAVVVDEEEDDAPAPKAKAPVVEEEDEAPAPKAKAKAPVVEEEEEAPAKRTTKAKTEAPPAADLASVVSGWDD